MKIGLQTWGSDGDIRPFLALAGGLRTAGHEVMVAYTSIDNKDYTSLAKAMSFDITNVYTQPNGNYNTLLSGVIKERNAVKQLRTILSRIYEPALDEMWKASEQLCQENDLVISHSVVHTLVTAAEKYHRPCVVVHFSSLTVRSNYVPPLGMPNLGNWINGLCWKLLEYIIREKLYPSANRIRAREGLPLIKNYLKEICISKELTLISTSPLLCNSQPDWDTSIEVCGFLDIPLPAENWDMPDDLYAFLDAGDPPIFLTFGSFTQFSCAENTQLFIDAVKLSGQRAIIQSDWDAIPFKVDDPDIHKIGNAPHHRIFPYCSVIVHHGGAGTTQSSLLSGCPSVVVEHAFDQIYWAVQLNTIGAAGKPLHKRSVTAKKISYSIRQVVNTPTMKEKAQRVGTAMKTENGVQKAVALINERFT